MPSIPELIHQRMEERKEEANGWNKFHSVWLLFIENSGDEFVTLQENDITDEADRFLVWGRAPDGCLAFHTSDDLEEAIKEAEAMAEVAWA